MCFDAHPACLPDATFDGSKCISKDKPACSVGAAFDGVSCIRPNQSVCPPGITYGGESCVSSIPPSMAKSCVSKNVPACAQVSIFNGKTCVAMEQPNCPAEPHLRQSISFNGLTSMPNRYYFQWQKRAFPQINRFAL